MSKVTRCNDHQEKDIAAPIWTYHRDYFADWDYLVILDSCRYDVFEEVVTELGILGKLMKADSGAINTSDWYKLHWSKEDTDAILVSANPWSFKDDASDGASGRFRKAIWADPEGKHIKGDQAIRARIEPLCKGGQDGGFGVFHPNIALECLSAYKVQGLRYVIHLIPPHLPFIGVKGQALFAHLKLDSHIHGGIYRAIRNYGKKGHWDELKECYKESLVATLHCLARYVESLSDGRLVISSDHGELIGEPTFDENGLYWHKVSGDT